MYKQQQTTASDSLQQLKDYGLVTVLMSVYKGSVDNLDRAVKSILSQSYSNLEFIVIDDGSDEEGLDYLKSITDARVRVLHNEKNMGLAASLNKGIKAAKGKYIARMDADDYSMPDRIYEQVKYMEEHSDIDVLACIALDICNGKVTGQVGGAYYRFDNDDMKIEMSLAPKTFPHPSVMFRKSFLDKTGLLYDEKFLRSQDYDMWARCIMEGKLFSLQKKLLLYDVSDKESLGLSDAQVYFSNLTKLKCLKRLLPDASDEEKALYVNMREMKLTGSVADNINLANKLVRANYQKRVYDVRKYPTIVFFWWGRKMFYKENREFIGEFLKNPAFMAQVIRAYIVRLPGHLHQKSYENKMMENIQKSGITL